ncbi:MAG: RNA polymerase sigma factor FliA [Salinisphaera sp.]|nr:RNA polymerase sigma factor FliA [Salinisphaera sp.]
MITPNAMYPNRAAHAGILAGENVDLVKRIAYRLISRLPSSVQIEDLIQAGMVGLLEAHERYSPDAGASFATFSGIRIRGAMLDEIRLGDWTPRSVHRAARAAAEASENVERRNGRPAADSEVAAELGVPLADYRKSQSDARASYLTSLEEVTGEEPGAAAPCADDDPQGDAERQNLYEAVVAASDKLPERERLLISLYYDRNLNLRQIAERLGVSESRACQLHGRAISRVRDELQAWAA